MSTMYLVIHSDNKLEMTYGISSVMLNGDLELAVVEYNSDKEAIEGIKERLNNDFIDFVDSSIDDNVDKIARQVVAGSKKVSEGNKRAVTVYKDKDIYSIKIFKE